ncbi:unnamed protein product [Trichobilharzia szidati]|nr:unnamed protein product [Trichobilharzia szidati]
MQSNTGLNNGIKLLNYTEDMWLRKINGLFIRDLSLPITPNSSVVFGSCYKSCVIMNDEYVDKQFIKKRRQYELIIIKNSFHCLKEDFNQEFSSTLLGPLKSVKLNPINGYQKRNPESL